MYCTIACLARGSDRMREKTTGPEDRLHLNDRARELVERALGLMHSGLTVRQAGDTIDVRTETLRSWFGSAGIAIDGHGMLAGVQDPSHARQQRPSAIVGFLAERLGGSPVSAVNELAQIRMLLDLRWQTANEGPPHAPLFTTTVTAIRADEDTTVTASGRSKRKSEAKSRAAEQLVRVLGEKPQTSTIGPHKE
ncbi:double-stranded RNA binding motif domain-containing protein [Streptomyces sp. NPDC055078]